LRIDCIADLVREKASIRGLYNEVLAKSVDLSNEPCCTPRDLLSFLLKNREVRRTYQVLAKGKGTSVLRMILPKTTQDGDLSLNMSSNSINEKATSSKLDFETFLEFVRTRGAVCGLSPRDGIFEETVHSE
jgi:hypothetical protein